MDQSPTRVIAVVLSEPEWRALLEVEPQPVGWLQRMIRERVGTDTDEASVPVALRPAPAAR